MREREARAERPVVAFWARKTWRHPVWPLIPILTATYRGLWVCLHLQAILIIIIITTHPTTLASTGYTHSMDSQEAWGPIPLSPDQSPNTSPQAWWPCAWKPKTPGACYPGRHDRAAAIAIAMTSLSQQTFSMPAHTGMLVLLRNTQLKNTIFKRSMYTFLFCRLPGVFTAKNRTLCIDLFRYGSISFVCVIFLKPNEP